MNAPEMNFRPKGLYIGGEWVSSTGNKTFETINPSNSQSLGKVPYATEEDVDRAVRADKKAFPECSRLPPIERARCLESLANRIDKHSEGLAAIRVKNINMRW